MAKTGKKVTITKDQYERLKYQFEVEREISGKARSKNLPRDIANRLIYGTQKSTAKAIRDVARQKVQEVISEYAKIYTGKQLEDIVNEVNAVYGKIVNASLLELRKIDLTSKEYNRLMEELGVSDKYKQLKAEYEEQGYSEEQAREEAARWMRTNVFGSK